jgi:hypothetical protein
VNLSWLARLLRHQERLRFTRQLGTKSRRPDTINPLNREVYRIVHPESILEKIHQITYNMWVVFRCSVSSQSARPGSVGHVRQAIAVAVFRLCARSRAPRPWSESLADFATKFAGYQVFATSRCARRDGAATLRVPIARDRDQRVRRRTENKSASTPSLDASFFVRPARSPRLSANLRSLARATEGRQARPRQASPPRSAR